MELGRTGAQVSRLGIGAMSWGNRSIMAYGGTDSPADEEHALAESLNAGVTLVDTAEMYGRGKSEQRVGDLVAGHPEVMVATKFAPLWWRRASSVGQALERSLGRLRRPTVDLYQVHWPPRFIRIPKLMDTLADAHRAGLVRAIGVSNFSAAQLRLAHTRLGERGIPLASNQLQYSLLHRHPEIDGVLDACRELGVTLIAYSPLAAGALSGKYDARRRPGGIRRMLPYFRARNAPRLEAVLHVLRDVAAAHDATTTAVALRWLMDRGALPIPGAKSGAQAAANAGALGIKLDPAEDEALTTASIGWRG